MLRRFPALEEAHLVITSDRSHRYNCFAFAVRDEPRWISHVLWEPVSQQYYWPAGAPRGDTVEGWSAALGTYGFHPCESADHEEGWEKVVIFATGPTATHVARQLPSGSWTSKIGKWEDIEHELHALEGDRYGCVAQILKRPLSQ